MPSLSITEGANGATYLHCFRGCTTEEILSAKGMRMGDLFADSGFKPSPEMRRVWADEERLKLCERQHGLAIMAQAVLPEERPYWAAVERNKAVEIGQLSDKLNPSEKKRRKREHEVQRIIREYGLTELWACLPIARLQARIAHQRKGYVPKKWSEMKCFKIESGGERFYWAGESSEDVLDEFKDAYDDFDDPAEITELSDEEMDAITVTVEDENTEPNGTSTLKKLFDDETKTCIGGAFELCGSVF